MTLAIRFRFILLFIIVNAGFLYVSWLDSGSFKISFLHILFGGLSLVKVIQAFRTPLKQQP